MPYRSMHPNAGHFGAWLFPLLFIFLIGLALHMILKNNREKDSPFGKEGEKNSTESALNILNERYAKGEIDQEEYQQIKKDLLGK